LKISFGWSHRCRRRGLQSPDTKHRDHLPLFPRCHLQLKHLMNREAQNEHVCSYRERPPVIARRFDDRYFAPGLLSHAAWIGEQENAIKNTNIAITLSWAAWLPSKYIEIYGRKRLSGRRTEWMSVQEFDRRYRRVRCCKIAARVLVNDFQFCKGVQTSWISGMLYTSKFHTC